MLDVDKLTMFRSLGGLDDGTRMRRMQATRNNRGFFWLDA
jgi:hypothetical protein